MITKITNEERADKGVTGLPDTPELPTMQMQQRFDSLGNLAIDGFNRAVDELNSFDTISSGASHIGAVVPENIIASTNVQSILDAIAAVALTTSAGAHTHDNKAVLDAITAEVKANYDRVASLLSGILSVQTTLTNSNDHIPTSGGVYNLLSDYDYSQLKLAMNPIGTVYFSHNAVSPDSFIGGVWERENLIDGVLSWRRTA